MQRVNAGHIVAVVGALALLVSLFLDWYEGGFDGEGVTAWTVFELIDLLLALIAVATIVAAASDLHERPRALDIDRWLPGLAAAALLLVAVSIINNPPAVTDSSEKVGAWIALAGAILMVVGALFGERRISIVLSPRDEGGSARTESHGPTGPATDPPGSEAKTRATNPLDPR